MSLVPSTVDRLTDEQVIQLWLRHNDKSPNTVRYYGRIARGLLFKPMELITLPDIQAYLGSLSPGTKSPGTAAIKSLFTFAAALGHLQYNVTLLIRVPRQKDELAQRILPEDSVLAMIDSLPAGRNHCILHLLYHAGLRVSELCSLKWSDIQEFDDHAVLSVLGKGQKLRYVYISRDMFCEMVEQANSALYVFTGQKCGPNKPLSAVQVRRIVRDAGLTIGVDGVSPHWMRHANASHALDNGAPLTTVRDSLGHSSVVVTERYLHSKPKDGSSRYVKR